MDRPTGRSTAIERAARLKGGLAHVSNEADQSDKLPLTNPHRVLRRLSGQMRMAAMAMKDRTVATKLLLMAVELEDAAKERRATSSRRN